MIYKQLAFFLALFIFLECLLDIVHAMINSDLFPHQSMLHREQHIFLRLTSFCLILYLPNYGTNFTTILPFAFTSVKEITQWIKLPIVPHLTQSISSTGMYCTMYCTVYSLQRIFYVLRRLRTINELYLCDCNLFQLKRDKCEFKQENTDTFSKVYWYNTTRPQIPSFD